MLKKLCSALLLAGVMIVGAAAAGSVFPAYRTDIDGVTRAGYLDEEGQTVLPYAYAQAGEFAACGMAAVENDRWETAVIDRTGKLVIPYTAAPVSVDFSDTMIAYRYADHSVYYTLDGKQVGSYAGAVGFFENDLLLCRSAASNHCFYVHPNGERAFPGEFADAGVFSGGRALVRSTDGAYLAIDAQGNTLYTLESSITPSYMTIFGEDTIVLSNGTNQALYSLSRSEYLTDFLYHTISEFEDGVAMVRQVNRWGLMDTTGRLLTEPTYYYLSYMGEGLYAARSEDGSAAAVDANGNIAYRTPSYVGGFNELRYGLSWHGMEDGTLVFFRKNGGYFASLKQAENPTLLSENVVRVTQDGTIKYINLSTGHTLSAQPTTFDLGEGLSAHTVHYEKFMGYQADGTEHGWNVDFPEIRGLPDESVQKSINQAIRAFFLEGPSVSAEYEALEGGYGAAVEGSVLVVWANCISGKGEGASVWNNCLAFDLRTGTPYQTADLFTGDYMDTIKALLPSEHPIYLYSFPRMSETGVTWYYNEYESSVRRAYTESYLLSFEQLDAVLDRTGACWQALHTPYTPAVNTVAGFRDVKTSHWAAEYIQTVADRSLMHGANGLFRPDDAITTAEVCATVARSRKLSIPETLMPGLDHAQWYAGEVSAVYAAGLLEGLTENFRPDAVMTRADAMQLFANLLTAQGAVLPDTAAAEPLLAPFSDAGQIPGPRRAAAALCIQKGLISGLSDSTLQPQGSFTRAAFAKLLTMI